VKLLHDWEWEEAERRFRRALALKPNLAIAHDWFAEFFMARGRTAEALSELTLAEELDPLSVILPTDRCRALYFARRYPDAIASCRRALDADPSFVPALITHGMVLEETGRTGDALAAFREVARLTGNDPQQRTLIARATALDGDVAAARRVLAEVEAQAQSRYISHYSLAVVHAALGDRDAAFRELDQAVAERSSWMIYVAVNPRLDALRDDPRFQDILKRVGLQ
jgi:serine/threonine-protein kinase